MEIRLSGRIAIVLFNLGGPDNLEAVRPFLFNLFADKAIIRLPDPARFLLAWLISARRTRKARAIYAEMGGGSPILPNTEAQARALERALADLGDVRAFVAMRYWHPMSQETAESVKAYAPDQIVLLPLYPQFSTTTTASSVCAWQRACREIGLSTSSRTVCCYPIEQGFIAAMAATLREGHAQAAERGRPRVLLSAHGLPEMVVASGDPYQWQCERTARAVVDAACIPDLDWVGTYQSRVGPLRWIGPSTNETIVAAGREGRPVVILPIAFVSEHSETLVELDIEYRHLAERSGVPFYLRLPTVGTAADFVAGLARSVRAALERPAESCRPVAGMRLCPAGFRGCPVDR
jgi:ferrochelatase